MKMNTNHLKTLLSAVSVLAACLNYYTMVQLKQELEFMTVVNEELFFEVISLNRKVNDLLNQELKSNDCSQKLVGFDLYNLSPFIKYFFIATGILCISFGIWCLFKSGGNSDNSTGNFSNELDVPKFINDGDSNKILDKSVTSENLPLKSKPNLTIEIPPADCKNISIGQNFDAGNLFSDTPNADYYEYSPLSTSSPASSSGYCPSESPDTRPLLNKRDVAKIDIDKINQLDGDPYIASILRWLEENPPF